MTRLLMLTREFFFYCLLLIIGLYAGMLFFHEMCPVETQLTPLEYVRYWKIVDGTFMHQRMGIMGPLMFGLFIVNIIWNVKQWKTRRFLLLLIAFIIFTVDVAFTINEQLPINVFINSVDINHISDSELRQLTRFQTAAVSNFQNRMLFGIASFASLCLVPFRRQNL